jgi:hypothetical protein
VVKSETFLEGFCVFPSTRKCREAPRIVRVIFYDEFTFFAIYIYIYIFLKRSLFLRYYDLKKKLKTGQTVISVDGVFYQILDKNIDGGTIFVLRQIKKTSYDKKINK